MRDARGKGNDARKVLSYFSVNFDINPPYQVLCDGPTIHRCLKNGLFLKEALPALLGNTAYPVVTECIVNELRDLGEPFSNATLFAKRANRVPCSHEEMLSAADCIISRIKESDMKLLLATNDSEILLQAHRKPGVPLLTISSQNKLVLRSPSRASMEFVRVREKVKVSTMGKQDQALLNQLEAEKKNVESVKMVRKRKRAKEPNPLSVKKSKKARTKESSSSYPPRSAAREVGGSMSTAAKIDGRRMPQDETERGALERNLPQSQTEKEIRDVSTPKKRRRRSKRNVNQAQDSDPGSKSLGIETKHDSYSSHHEKSSTKHCEVKQQSDGRNLSPSREMMREPQSKSVQEVTEDHYLREKQIDLQEDGKKEAGETNPNVSNRRAPEENDSALQSKEESGAERAVELSLLEPHTGKDEKQSLQLTATNVTSPRTIRVKSEQLALTGKASNSPDRAAPVESKPPADVVPTAKLQNGEAASIQSQAVKKKKQRKNRRRRPKKASTD